MTSEQIEISLQLGKATYLPGSFDKRLGLSLSSMAQTHPEKELSDKQNEWMYRLLYKYRNQLPNTFKKYSSNPLCSKKV